MAMTKKERAMVADLEWKLAQALALAIQVEPVERDLPPPSYEDGSGAMTRGWDFNAYNQQVYKACSSSVYHGHGWDKATSQRPLSLFSTRSLALKALRNAVHFEMVRKLANIDLMIAASQGQEGGK